MPYLTAAIILVIAGLLLWAAPVSPFIFRDLPEDAALLSSIGQLVVVVGVLVGAAGAFRKQ